MCTWSKNYEKGKKKMEENEDINVHEKIVQFNSKFNIRISN